MTDLVTFGETMLRLSPEDGERIETATSLDLRAAGAESNVAVAAARLGAESQWLSKLPDSALGRRVTQELESHGVDTRVCWTDEYRQGTYYIEQGSRPRPTNVIYDRADAAVTTALPSDLDTDAIAEAEMFYTSGITPALSETLERTASELLELAHSSDTATAFDLNYRSKLWSTDEAREVCASLFQYVDILFVPVRDAGAVLDYDGSPEAIAEQLAAEFDFELVVVTRGAEGATAFDGEHTYEQSAFETDTVDPVGTGDAFVGAFLARWLAGDTVDDALTYAAATAALKRTIAGDVAVVTQTEVQRVIADSADGILR